MLPTSVEDVLNDYIDLFQTNFPNTLKGLYMHGSIVLDSYVQGWMFLN